MVLIFSALFYQWELDMADYPGKTIVSKIMQGLNKNSQQICRDTKLPMFQVMALAQGRMSFDSEKADQFAAAYPQPKKECLHLPDQQTASNRQTL